MGTLHKIYDVFRSWDTRRFLRNIKFLIENDIHTAHALLKDEIIEDCVFELDELKEFYLSCTPKILDIPESLALLESQPKSFARFGDGEVDLMQGKDIAFQKYDPVLAEKMLRVLKTKRDDLYIGINSLYFHTVHPLSNERQRKYYRGNSHKFRKFFMDEANLETLYLDANCLMGYFDYNYRDTYGEIVQRKKKIFEGRKIAIVTGKSVLEKLDYDIFDLASSKIIIDAPSTNAFSEYDAILSDISRNVSKDTMIHLILGPTATAMAADLADMGYIAWDSGYMAKDYDFYMKKLEKSSKIEGEFYSPD